MTLGVAIVGCGLIGEKRLAALPERAALVSVFDVDPARAAALAGAASGAVKVANSAAEAIDDERIDLVIVATPHRELATMALHAVRAGRHVLVEKPGAHSVGPLVELESASLEAGVQVRVGFNHRFHPALLRARELVDHGGYGRILNLRARYGHGGRLGYEHEWRVDRERSGGGELVDQGVHLIDLTRFLGGDVEFVFAALRTEFWRIDVEDNAFLALRLQEGSLAWLHASWTEWKNLFSFEVALERAKIEVTGLGGSYGTESLRLYEMSSEMGPPATTIWEWPGRDDSWCREVDDLLRAIDGRETLGATVADAIAALRIVEAAYAQ